MRQDNEGMDIDVKVTLTIKGKEIELTLDELKQLRDKVNTILGSIDKEYVPVPYPNDKPYVPDPVPPWRQPIITYMVSSWSSSDE